MKINLLPPEYRPQPLVNPKRLFVMILGSFLCMGSLVFAGYEYLTALSAQNRLVSVKNELQSYVVYKEKLKMIEEMQQRVGAYKKELKQFETIYPKHTTLVNGIAAALSDQIWLTDLSINPGGNIQLKGDSLDFSIIGDFLGKLEKTDGIQDCKLNKIIEMETDQITSYQFEIQMKTGRDAANGAEKK